MEDTKFMAVKIVHYTHVIRQPNGDDSKQSHACTLHPHCTTTYTVSQKNNIDVAHYNYTVSQKNVLTLKRYSSKLQGAILMKFGRNIQNTLE